MKSNKAHQSIQLALIACSLLYLASCSKDEQLVITNSAIDSCYFLKLNEHHPSTFGIDITFNSLNDTSIVDGIKIPAKTIGTLYKGNDYYTDTVSVCYEKYRASQGQLILSYYY